MLAAFGMIVLLMMAGLGVDVGYLKYQKQQMQKAADAGALGAASAMIYYGTGNQTQIQQAGWDDAAANGFDHTQPGVTVQVNNPPQTVGDPFYNNLNYVEVIVSQARPTFFMQLAGYNSINVSSRAVATAVGSGSACVYSLAPSGTNTLDVTGATYISSNCGVLVNSASLTALSIANRDNIAAYSIGVVGQCQSPECQGVLGSGDENILTEGIAPFTDPLANLPSPFVPPCQAGLNINHPETVSPGSYCGGITVNTNGNVTFSPGTYYLVGGGLNIPAGVSPNLSGDGVTFYNTGNATNQYQPISIQGTPTGSLTAPTTGDMAGILFYQNRNIGVNNQMNYVNGQGRGSNGMIYTGALYFPTTPLTYTGGDQGVNPYELLIAWTLNLSGNIVLENNYSSLPNEASPIANAILVE